MRREWLTRISRMRSVGCATVALFVLAIATVPASADTIRSQQWYLDAMHAEEMWKTSTGAGVTVAVIDSGVDANLPDLQGQVLPGKDFSGIEVDTPPDYDGHGTEMAVLIAGTGSSNGGRGSFGLAPGVKILPLRVANDKAPRTKLLSGATVYSAVRFAADSDAKVINISMGMPAGDPEGAKAIEYALSKGKIIFASAGNRGDKGNDVEYPAAYPGVIGVAAVDQDIKATSWSHRGPEVDLAAPGDNMVAACIGGTGLCRSHGTSDATALTSASAALLWSAHPDWTANQVLRVLINTAGGPKSGEKRSDSIGYGVVRPRIALQNPGDPGPADISPLPELAAAKSPADNAAKTAPPPASKQADKADSSLLSKRTLIAVSVIVAAAAVTAAAVFTRRRRMPGN
ncbi:type VII secretion-associated serine protease mycosin [Streptomyces abikoensis]|uniref:type VII secretion-associated serine protease mycosin n=1 Tax=Streptomyces abikoensis TaxID=97398 RepID=UPI0033EF27DB